MMKTRRLILLALTIVTGLWLAVNSDRSGQKEPKTPIAHGPHTPVPQIPESDATSITAEPKQITPRAQFTSEAPVIGTAWNESQRPEMAAFRDWTQRYLATAADDRARLVPEGQALARERRAVLAALIRQDPRAALAAAVPMVVRQQLPAEILARLETRVSGTGELALNAVTPAPGQTVTEPEFRSTLLAGREYRAYVYGARAAAATVGNTSMIGIAVDAALAVADARLRVLEPGEIAGNRSLDPVDPISGQSAKVDSYSPLNLTALVAVEYDQKINVLSDPRHVNQLEAALIAEETTARDLADTAADNQPGTSGVASRPSQAWTHGTKKILIIRVDFPDATGVPTYPSGGAPITEDYAVNLFTSANGIEDFFAQSSYGKTALTIEATVAGDSPDVTDVLRLPQNAVYYATNGFSTLLHTDARAAAETAGFNVDSYDRIGVVFRNLGTSFVANSQITYGGLGNIEGKNFWVNGYYDFRVVAHELGHTYGLHHSNLWQVNDGNPVSAGGTSIEYGDIFELMGSGGNFENDLSPWSKNLLHWIPDTAVTVAQAPGTYRIYRFDAAAANLNNARALKIVRDSTRDYWIGYRRGTTNPSMDGGAYVMWGYNENMHGDLLDLNTPGTDPTDAGLAVGATFTDTLAGITLHPIAQGGTGAEEYLDVQVELTPLVQWQSATYTAAESGGSITLTVARTRNSTGAIAVNYATAAGTAISPADFTAAAGTLNWSDGDTSDRTVTITLASDALVEGAETFTVLLSGASGCLIGDLATATVSIVDAGVRDTAFAAEFINSTVEKVLPLPDGSMILGGWFDTVQDTNFEVFSRQGVTKLNATGTLDPTFAADGGSNSSPVYDLALQPDGKIIAVGDFTSFNGITRNYIVRLLPDGSVDPTFDPGEGPDGKIYKVLVQPDGKIVIGGTFYRINGDIHEYVARLNPDGTVDELFNGPDFGSSGGWRVESLALQPDGKLLVGGSFYFVDTSNRAGLRRLTTTGALDGTFNGVMQGAHLLGETSQLRSVTSILVQPDGKILIAGAFTAFNNTARSHIARLTSTGALDPDFAPTIDGNVNTLLLQPDGNIILGGAFTTIDGNPAARLAMLSAAGVFNSDFSASGGYNTDVQDLVMLPDGQVLLGGGFGSLQGATPSRPVWRLFGGLAGSPGSVQLATTSGSGPEGGDAEITVTRSGSGIGALTVGYATVTGSATAADFTPTSGVLTWTDGDTAAKTIIVPLTPDSLSDGGETFLLNLGLPQIGGALLGANQQTTITINDPILSGYAAWQAEQFSSGELSDDNISGPTADPDGDGLSNLLEYALGLDPKSTDTTELPEVSTTETDWVYTYTRPTDRAELTYEVEVSTNLSSWTITLTPTYVSSSDDTETWQATYSLSSATNAFFRLKITD